jgi:hypothetical protein
MYRSMQVTLNAEIFEISGLIRRLMRACSRRISFRDPRHGGPSLAYGCGY